MDLEAKVQELEAKLVVLDGALAEKTKAHDEALAEIVRLQAENKRLDAQVKELDKEITLLKSQADAEKEKVQRDKDDTQAESDMKEILTASSIPEAMYVKVKKQISVDAYRKDGKLDTEAFKAAFQSEVTDWESKLPKSGGLGAGDPKEDGAPKGPQSAFGDENKELLATYKK